MVAGTTVLGGVVVDAVVEGAGVADAGLAVDFATGFACAMAVVTHSKESAEKAAALRNVAMQSECWCCFMIDRFRYWCV